ncbi:hypothetical protein [Couchioplanes azureus]|uniref:hypothetical protein n=1 Tax=Couchioplanes caeruleus TaxID=56438 RepID=UPI0016714941|nr:hypothetical protein [Couchioplanes caeruleus]GGQ75096.1 hypothetical protein GCM10010166_51290 [Couchioplanes caeruleus subsp. azureus]
MSDSEVRADRHPTDEPDGTTAHAASLRPPGESVTTGEDDPGDQREAGMDGGYDAAAVSGDTDAYRPD